MSTIAIVLLFTLCIFCYTGQNFGNRLFSGQYVGGASVASAVFSCIYGTVIVVVTFCLCGFQFAPNGAVWALGIGNGVIVFLYNYEMIQAARRGPYSFQCLMVIFGGNVMSILFSVLYWGDHLTILQIIGIVGMLASLVLLNGGSIKIAGAEKGYMLYSIGLFFTNGIFNILMDAQHRIIPTQRNEMIIVSFGVNAVISFAYLFTLRKKTMFQAFKMSRKAALYALLSSTCAAFAVFVLMLILVYVPSYIIYPARNGMILAVNVLLSAWILHEKMTKPMLVGIVMSVASLALLTV